MFKKDIWIVIKVLNAIKVDKQNESRMVQRTSLIFKIGIIKLKLNSAMALISYKSSNI
jgi:hypothetical protein